MSIQKILWPLLVISYVCGVRVIEFPAGVPRQWFSLLYMLLVWLLYTFLLIYKIIPCTSHFSMLHHIWFGINLLTALLSIIVGVYHNKRFRDCTKDLTTVNNILEKLGTITDHKLYIRTIWLILGWFMIIILVYYCESQMRNDSNCTPASTIYVFFIRIYCINVNVIGDIIITSMLGYVGLKFDQINKHLEKLIEDNEVEIKQVWEHSTLLFHQYSHTKVPKSAHILWVVIHLHSELRKISRKIDLIFGVQMTVEMGSYFVFVAWDFQDVFNMILITDYNINIFHIILMLVGLFLHICRLFLINYECERVSIKANVTGNIISKLLYSNCDVKIRENILQFLLMTQSPIRFCGLGLFEFGFKFLRGFITSVVTVLVILLQNYTNG